jgi:general secretion pathway protein G
MNAWAENVDGTGQKTEGRGQRAQRAGRRRPVIAPVGSGGFTLIELMLVLVILATLAAIVVPKFTGQSKKAKITAAKTQISHLALALDAFEIDLGRYPTNVEGLRALIEKPASESDGWERPYLSGNVPLDPWGNEYVYRCPGDYNQDGYDLVSYGPDGRLGGDDDITNWSEDVRQ